MRRFSVRVETIALVSAIALATSVPAQERTVAIRDARVVTMEGKPLSGATVLMRGGVIEAVGTDVEIPAGAEIVDAKGGTVMPGLVSAYSRAGLTAPRSTAQRPTRGRRRGGARSFQRGSTGSSAKNEAAKKVIDGLYARQDVFAELLACGVTTIGLTPAGSGFPGQGAVIDPAGHTLAELQIDDEAFVLIKPATGTTSKKVLKESFEKAQKVVEERKKPAPVPEAKKPEEKKAEKKESDAKKAAEGDAKGEKEKTPPEKKEEKPAEKSAKQEPKKAAKPKPKPKKKDPNIEVLADVLEGKRRAFLEISSATALVHFLDYAGKTELPKHVLIAPSHSSSQGRLDEVLDKLEKHKGLVLTTPGLTTPNYSRAVINPAARLTAGGFEVGFILGDNKSTLRRLFYQLIEQVRHGLDPDAALAAVTLVPAKALGVEDRVGSIQKGKDADLLLFDGDPLDPTSKLVRIWHKGRAIDEERTQ